MQTSAPSSRWIGTATLAAGVLAAVPSPVYSADRDTQPVQPWDWNGVIGTGQSLSVGAQGLPVLTTSQPFGNLKLSTDSLPWEVDPKDPKLKMVPLVEPIGRRAPAYPSSWPENIDGETPHTAMANQISALVRAQLGRDYVSVHSAIGEDGQGMVFLKKNAVPKGLNGRSYRAALIETEAIHRLAQAARKSFGVAAIVVTHGESDAGNLEYEQELWTLLSNYNTDLRAITGQTRPLLMIVSQQNSCNDHSPSTLAQWKLGVDHPADAVCSGPKYQYPSAEGVHLTAEGYRQLGEKYGQVFFERCVLGKPWQPLQPLAVERRGRVITVRFHVPVAPLVWDDRVAPPHGEMSEWRAGKGFEVSTSAKVPVPIESVSISGDAVVITCAADPGPGALLSYAMVGEKDRMAKPFAGTFRWGCLRDSDPFTGSVTGTPQPNYAVAFDWLLPDAP